MTRCFCSSSAREEERRPISIDTSRRLKNTAFLGSPLFAYFALRHGSDSALKSVGLSAVAAVWASRRCVTTRRSARARSRGLSSARAGSRPGSCGLPRRAARRFRARPPVRPSRRGRTPRRERGGFRAPRRGDGRASRPPRRFRTRARPRRLPRPAAGFVRCASPSSERRARRAAWTIEGEKTSSWRVWRSNRRAPSGVNARRRTRTDTNTNASKRRTGARREKRATRTPRRDCLPVRPFTNARTSRRRRMRRRRLVGFETNARCPRTSTA